MHEHSVRFEDILEDCIAAILAGRETAADCLDRYPAHRQELESLLRLTLRLQAVREVHASPEFRQVASARMHNLIAASPRRPRPAVAGAVRGRAEQGRPMSRFTGLASGLRSLRRLPAAAVVILLLGVWLLIGGGTVYASAQALPGDSLYTVKRAVESVRLSLSPNEARAACLRLDFAGRRLSEATILLEQNRPQDVLQALADYESELEMTLDLLDAAGRFSSDEQRVLAGQLAAETDRHAVLLAGLLQQLPELQRRRAESTLTTVREGRDHAQAVIEGRPDEGLVPPTATSTPTVSPTSTPKPPATTPAATATATASPTRTPKPPTPTPTPVPDTPTPPPTATPAPDTPTPPPPTPAPTETPVPAGLPSWWPPGCPDPTAWPPGEWPEGCPPAQEWPDPSQWPGELPDPPEWLSDWLSKLPDDWQPGEWTEHWPDQWREQWPDEWPDVSDLPDGSESPDVPGWPDGSNSPDVPDWPDESDFPDVPDWPDESEGSDFPDLPGFP
jgi:hypothetical protein